MRQSTRLIANTTAQYTRTVINVVLSLYSTRLILLALGESDYGIFTLIGGVVSLLSFVTSALVVTTQRFMSFYQSKNDYEYLKELFGNSLGLHAIISIVVLIAFEAIGPFLFNGFLNIDPQRIDAAKIVYQCAICMLIMAFMNSPFRALLISHENLVYCSIVDVLNGVLKVGIATYLTYYGTDKLVNYAFLMICVTAIDGILYILYDIKKYKECSVKYFFKLKKTIIKEMASFIGWTIYSTMCIIGRTQGTAVVLNKFFGTVLNAAFGIALQVSGAIAFISNSALSAISPQIVKAEGAGNRKLMLQKSAFASKISFLLLAILVVPLCYYTPYILKIWLKEVPENAALFSRVIMITALVDQLTIGLGTANRAIGHIRNYSIVVNTIKVLTVPVIIILLLCNVPINQTIWVYVLIEFICAMVRIPYLKRTAGLNVSEYCKSVFFRILRPILLILALYTVTWMFMPVNLGLIIVYGIVITIFYILSIYWWGLDSMEKNLASQLLGTIKSKLKH